MEEKLQQAVATLIQKSISAFESGADFLSEQLPDVVHQLLMWHALKSAILCATGVTILLAWLIADVKIGRWVWSKINEYGEDAFLLGYLMLGSLPRILVATIVGNTINLTWLQIWIAPKVWLIEYGMNLVKP